MNKFQTNEFWPWWTVLKKTDEICCKPFAYHFLNRICNFDRCTTNNSLSSPKQNSMKRYKWKWSVEKWDKNLFLWCFACIESSSFFEIKGNWNQNSMLKLNERCELRGMIENRDKSTRLSSDTVCLLKKYKLLSKAYIK